MRKRTYSKGYKSKIRRQDGASVMQLQVCSSSCKNAQLLYSKDVIRQYENCSIHSSGRKNIKTEADCVGADAMFVKVNFSPCLRD